MIRKANVGRHLYGAAAFAFGIVTLLWHTYNDWDLQRDLWGARGGFTFVYVVSSAQIFGGLAIQFRRSARIGAIVLGAVFLSFASLWASRIVATPMNYDLWGNFFEQFSLLIGAALVYASTSPSWNAAVVSRIGGLLLGFCAASFGIQQARHLNATVGLVPKWLPPNQMVWAVLTTIGFALAALALFTNRLTLLALRLMTLMVGSFGLIVWVPMLVSNSSDRDSWGETIETFAIAGAVWILADFLRGKQRKEGNTS